MKDFLVLLGWVALVVGFIGCLCLQSVNSGLYVIVIILVSIVCLCWHLFNNGGTK